MRAPIVAAGILTLAFQSQSPSPASAQTSAATADGCPVTAPNGARVPWATISPSRFDHGNAAISTSLWPDGTVVVRPNGSGEILTDGSLRMKFLWFKRPGVMTIEGRRLDGAAGPLRANLNHEFDAQDFQPSSLIFPTEGCWEVTSRVRDASLTFVTRVVQGPARPATRG
jgi:hypothetical protein